MSDYSGYGDQPLIHTVERLREENARLRQALDLVAKLSAWAEKDRGYLTMWAESLDEPRDGHEQDMAQDAATRLWLADKLLEVLRVARGGDR